MTTFRGWSGSDVHGCNDVLSMDPSARPYELSYSSCTLSPETLVFRSRADHALDDFGYYYLTPKLHELNEEAKHDGNQG